MEAQGDMITILGYRSWRRFLQELKEGNSKTTLNLNNGTLRINDIIDNLEFSLKGVYLDIIDPLTGEYKEGSIVNNPLFPYTTYSTDKLFSYSY